jgi:hypothetical protein
MPVAGCGGLWTRDARKGGLLPSGSAGREGVKGAEFGSETVIGYQVRSWKSGSELQVIGGQSVPRIGTDGPGGYRDADNTTGGVINLLCGLLSGVIKSLSKTLGQGVIARAITFWARARSLPFRVEE